jgi:hypothetical protein
MATTTPNYGWPVPTSTDYVKDGATAIEALGDAIDATVFGLPSGSLTLVKTQTIGSAVSTVTVTSCFSTTYDNYLLTISGGVSSQLTHSAIQFNNSTGSTYKYGGSYQYYSSATITGEVGSSQTYGWIGAVSPTLYSLNAYIFNPFSTSATEWTANYVNDTTIGSRYGIDTNSASNTGFTFALGAGTMTGGTIRVYGYQKA